MYIPTETYVLKLFQYVLSTLLDHGQHVVHQDTQILLCRAHLQQFSLVACIGACVHSSPGVGLFTCPY